MLRSYWPIIVTFGGGLVAFGALSSDVSRLQDNHVEVKADMDRQRASNAADHDLLVRLNTQQAQTTEVLGDLKDELKELSRLLRRPSMWDRMTGRDTPERRTPAPNPEPP